MRRPPNCLPGLRWAGPACHWRQRSSLPQAQTGLGGGFGGRSRRIEAQGTPSPSTCLRAHRRGCLSWVGWEGGGPGKVVRVRGVRPCAKHSPSYLPGFAPSLVVCGSVARRGRSMGGFVCGSDWLASSLFARPHRPPTHGHRPTTNTTPTPPSANHTATPSSRPDQHPTHPHPRPRLRIQDFRRLQIAVWVGGWVGSGTHAHSHRVGPPIRPTCGGSAAPVVLGNFLPGRFVVIATGDSVD